MNSESESSATRIARDYYNSTDADLFYREVWGGEDIHVGLYEAGHEAIATASRRTVERMVELTAPWTAKTRVIDLGAGYGGSLRYIADRFGSRCVALNLSSVENERNRRMNRAADLDDRIDVVEGDFASLDFADSGFDRAWSQEAFLHSGERRKVLSETARILRPGGQLVFTDPMQADGACPDSLQDIYGRLHLDSLASPSFYRNTLSELGLREIAFEEYHDQLARHYARVREVLIEKTDDLVDKGVDMSYIEQMKTGLKHWVEGGRRGLLTWGIFVFEKPPSH